LGKSSFSFKKRNKEKFSNWKYPIAKSNKTKQKTPPKLIYVMLLVIRNFQSLSSYFSITYIKILLLVGEVDFLTAYFSTFIENK